MRTGHRGAGGLLFLAFVVATAIVRGQGPAAPAASTQDHSGQYAAADVAIGQKVYATVCAACHGPTGNAIGNVDLRRGPLPRAATDDALRAVITKGFPQSGMPGFKFEPAELNGLVAFIRSGLEGASSGGAAPAAGDAALGRLVFDTRGKCLECHRVFDAGMFVGPELTEIGRLRSPAALQRSLVDPTGNMQPINRPVRAVKRDGTVITGRRLNEDLFTVQLITNEGKLVSLVKPELKEWTVGTTSTMPSYRDSLSSSELTNLVAYLMSLKGARP
jgi:putative heme-binding domain-containing protein